MNTNIDLSTVCLLPLDSVDMDHPSLSVHLRGDVRLTYSTDRKNKCIFFANTHLDNLSGLLAFEMSASNHDFIVLSYRQGPYVVLLPELLR